MIKVVQIQPLAKHFTKSATQDTIWAVLGSPRWGFVFRVGPAPRAAPWAFIGPSLRD